MPEPLATCPKCGHRFTPTRFWNIVARTPHHPIWIACYLAAGAWPIVVICNKFDADELTRLAALVATFAGVLGGRKVIAKVTE